MWCDAAPQRGRRVLFHPPDRGVMHVREARGGARRALKTCSADTTHRETVKGGNIKKAQNSYLVLQRDHALTCGRRGRGRARIDDEGCPLVQRGGVHGAASFFFFASGRQWTCKSFISKAGPVPGASREEGCGGRGRRVAGRARTRRCYQGPARGERAPLLFSAFVVCRRATASIHNPACVFFCVCHTSPPYPHRLTRALRP